MSTIALELEKLYVQEKCWSKMLAFSFYWLSTNVISGILRFSARNIHMGFEVKLFSIIGDQVFPDSLELG